MLINYFQFSTKYINGNLSNVGKSVVNTLQTMIHSGETVQIKTNLSGVKIKLNFSIISEFYTNKKISLKSNELFTLKRL